MEEKDIKIINVIPITKGGSKDHLSYFTSIDVPLGGIVEIPIRKKTFNGIVISKENLEDMKGEIKSSPFSIKKIEQLKASYFLSEEFILACRKSADFFATNTGSILNSVIPKGILENLKKIGTKKVTETETKEKNIGLSEKMVIQTDEEERYANYKSLIREEFARKSSVFFCLPTLEDIKKAKDTLEKGIEKYTFVFHSYMEKKEMLKIWEQARDEEHPVLIIGTGSFLSIERKDLGTIIIEKENSPAYKSQIRPYIDYRVFAEILAEKIKTKIIFGDSVLRTETIWKQKNGEFSELAPIKYRSLSSALVDLVDMKKESEEEFKIIGKNLEELIKQNKQENENLFIFGARKGLYPTTVCGDCEKIVMCNNCNVPTVLHTSKDNFFLCHKCGERRIAAEKCKNCGSWKLNTIGIGIDRIEKEIKEKYPEIKVFKIDKDNTKTHAKAEEVAEKFYNAPGSILIGTEMALLYLNKKIENSAVVSIDSMFSIPDYRINEKIFHILIKMRSLAQRKFIMQTRNPDESVIDYATKGNIIDFYREEIQKRESFGYPPFVTLIKITLQGKKDKVTKDMEELQKLFGESNLNIFPAFISTVKGNYVMNAILKVPQGKWVQKNLLDKIVSLPPQYSVRVDPDSLL